MHEHHLLDHSIYLHKGMPIGATAHPSLTAIASALRVGDHIAARLS